MCFRVEIDKVLKMQVQGMSSFVKSPPSPPNYVLSSNNNLEHDYFDAYNLDAKKGSVKNSSLETCHIGSHH
jgi:hypothetical protein